MTDAPYDPYAPNADPSVPINTQTPINGKIVIDDYDPAWPDMYQHEEARIRSALGNRAILVEHVGSTAVPGLPAKPCIDIMLAVADSADEPTYVPELEAAGYVLRIREPEWHEHRCFKGRDINLNLHIWTNGDSEIDRHLRFRDWLRTHDDDRDLYAQAKRELSTRHWGTMQEYADSKNSIIQQIQHRMNEAT